MFPVSMLPSIGISSSQTRIAVASGRRAYAQRTVQSQSRSEPPRQTNHATFHGSIAHGANRGSIQGAYT